MMDTYEDIYEPINRRRLFLLVLLLLSVMFYYSNTWSYESVVSYTDLDATVELLS